MVVVRMKLVLMLVAVLVTVNCEIDVKDYLQTFGYYNPNSFDQSSVSDALKNYQNTFGLPETGVADDATMKLMKTPRCGVADHGNNAFSDAKWSKKALTYYYNNYTPDMSNAAVRRLTERALRYWSDVTPITFTERRGGDIVISFGSKSHHDGRKRCAYPFNGRGGVLAHAFFPPDGRLHYDEDEYYTEKSSSGTNYLWVATHELGHILGLEHDTNTRDAVMYPYYRSYNPNGMKLHGNDIRRIQRQYGTGTGGGATPPPTQPPTRGPATTFSLQHSAGRCLSVNSVNQLYLTSSCSTKFLLTSSGKLQLAGSSKCAYTQWKMYNAYVYFKNRCGQTFQRTSLENNGYFSLKHVQSGFCLHPLKGSPRPTEGTRMVIYKGCDERRLKFKEI